MDSYATQMMHHQSHLQSCTTNPVPGRKRSRAEDDHESHQSTTKKTRHYHQQFLATAEFASSPLFSLATARDFSPSASASTSTSSASTPASEDVNMEMDTEVILNQEQLRQQQQLQQIQLQVQQHLAQQQAMEQHQQQQNRCTIISGFNQRLRSQQPMVATTWPNTSGYF